MNLATASASSALAAVGALCNSGFLKFYTGSIPSTPETAATGTLLATFDFSTTAFGAPSFSSPDEQMTASFTSSTVTPAANGTVGYARAFKSDGSTAVADFTVGTSSADIIVGSTSFSTGVQVNLSSFVLQLPAS